MQNYRISVTQTFTFHAAHVLPWHPGKCARLHGHSYRIEVRVEGPLDANGIVIDFDDVGTTVQTHIIEPLDHTLLNDTLPNPTAELLGIHIMDAAEKRGLILAEVRVWETTESAAVISR